MAGERSVKISFEAREEISQAVAKIERSLEGLDKGLKESAANLSLTDQAAEQLEGSLDEVGDEAEQAVVSLSALQAQLAGLEATSGTQGVQIPIELDDPSDSSFEEIRTKVAAKLRESPEKFDIGAKVDAEELATEIEEAEAEAEAAAGKVQMDAEVSSGETADLAEDVRDAVNEVESVSGNIDIGFKGPSRGQTFSAIGRVSQSIQEIEEVVGDIDIGFSGPSQGQTFSAVGRVSQAMQEIEETAGTIDLKFGGPSQGQIFSATGRVAAATKEIQSVAGDIELDIEVDASDDVMELATLVSSMTSVQAQALATAASSRTAASGIDEMGDEAAESAAQMGLLSSAASALSVNTTALSLNLGAFNIALSNLATQVPILLASVGTLATGLLGVGGAALFAATGVSAIVAGGVLSEITRLEEEFDNIEDSAQALQAIMKSLAESFREAFAPLTEIEGTTQRFFDLVNGLLTTVNAFAKGIASSMRFSKEETEEFIEVGKRLGIIDDEMSDAQIDAQIMSLGEFMDELGRIWNENVQDIIRGVKIMSAFLLPVLADIIEFFVSGFDDMVIFVTKFTKELTTVGPALEKLLNFVVRLINLGSTVLQGLLPVFVGLIKVASEVADTLNEVEPTIMRNVAGTLLLAGVIGALVGSYYKLKGVIGLIISKTQLEIYWKSILAIRNAILADKIGLVTAARVAGNVTLKRGLMLIQSVTAAKIAQHSITGKLVVAIWKYVGAAKSWILTNSKLAASIWGAVSGLWSLASSAAASGLAFFASYIPGVASGTLATGSLTAAVLSLHAATGGLTALLAAIAAAAMALVTAGALVVGGMANMDSVTSGLKGALTSIKNAFYDLVDVLLESFISVWNSIMIGFQGFMDIWNSISGGIDKIAQALGFAGTQGSWLAGIWDAIMVGIDLLLKPFEMLYRVIAQVAFVIGGMIATAIDIFVEVVVIVINIIKKLNGIFNSLIDWVLKFVGVSGGLSGAIDEIVGAFEALIDAIMSIPEVAGQIFDWFVGLIEDAANSAIEVINDVIRQLPDEVSSEIGISTIDKVNLTGPSDKGQIDKDDVMQDDTDDAEDNTTEEESNNFNYNEHNVNNVSQTVNADPEDKESLRRVVKDAMEEANAFNRRNQGHGG